MHKFNDLTGTQEKGGKKKRLWQQQVQSTEQLSLYKNAHSQLGIFVMTAFYSGIAELTCLHAKVVSGAKAVMSEAKLLSSRFFLWPDFERKTLRIKTQD